MARQVSGTAAAVTKRKASGSGTTCTSQSVLDQVAGQIQRFVSRDRARHAKNNRFHEIDADPSLIRQRRLRTRVAHPFGRDNRLHPLEILIGRHD